MTEPVVTVVVRDGDEARLWSLVGEVTRLLDGLPWLLIGGLMVRIIEAEHGRTTSYSTVDVDTVLDVRTVSTAAQDAAERLRRAGFEPARMEEGTIFRFERGDDIVDILAPDHLRPGTGILTVPPATTLQALGTRRALGTARHVRIDAGAVPFSVRVPSLLGAIVLKARVAANAQGSRAKHERDFARLLTLVPDPVEAAASLDARDRKYLRHHVDLVDPSHRAWRGVAGARDGSFALGILAEVR